MDGRAAALATKARDGPSRRGLRRMSTRDERTCKRCRERVSEGTPHAIRDPSRMSSKQSERGADAMWCSRLRLGESSAIHGAGGAVRFRRVNLVPVCALWCVCVCVYRTVCVARTLRTECDAR